MASGVKINDEVFKEYTAFKSSKKGTYIILKLNDQFSEIIIDETGPPAKSLAEQKKIYEEDFLAKLREAEEKKENRYAFYDFKFAITTQNGSIEKNKILLVNWNPDNAAIKSKMVYASSSQALLAHLKETGKKFMQVSTVDELEYDAITKEFVKNDRTE